MNTKRTRGYKEKKNKTSNFVVKVFQISLINFSTQTDT